MSLGAAAAAMGLPEALVQRSAEARAAETGSSVDEILAAWAGGEAPPTAASAPAEAAPATPSEDSATPEAPPAQAEPVPQPVVASAPTPPAATTRAPVPDRVTPGEASRLPEVITVPTAGIRERTDFVIPKWLTAVFLIVPLFALFALGGSATGECGEATELQRDVVSGEIVNCDGSAFTGQQIGGGGTDFVALGEEIYAGSAVTGVNCAGCHGPSGQGVGNFPALTGVMTTFGSCTDHIAWIELGSSNWPDATYGDTNKQVGGGMPGFASSLSEEQIAAVTAFERVRFGGGDETEVLTDCGLVEAEGEEGEGATEGGDEGATEGEAEASAAHSG